MKQSQKFYNTFFGDIHEANKIGIKNKKLYLLYLSPKIYNNLRVTKKN